MEAGAFLAQGADTCVFDPALLCYTVADDGTLVDDPTYVTGHVSRVVNAKSGELALQDRIKLLVPPKYTRFFNFYVKACSSFLFEFSDSFKEEDNSSCTLFKEILGKQDTKIIDKSYGLLNMITPKLQKTLFDYRRKRKDPHDMRGAMKRLLLMLIDLEGRFVYADGHDDNIAWNTDYSELVLFDFGRTLITKGQYKSFLAEVEEDYVIEYYATFKQYFYVMTALRYFKKSDLLTDVTESLLRNVWDLLSLLGTIEFGGYDSETNTFRRWTEPFYPNIEECALSIIEYIGSLTYVSDYSKDEIRAICARTIFQASESPKRLSPGLAIPKTLSKKL